MAPLMHILYLVSTTYMYISVGVAVAVLQLSDLR
jgi:hypothetical protein